LGRSNRVYKLFGGSREGLYLGNGVRRYRGFSQGDLGIST